MLALETRNCPVFQPYQISVVILRHVWRGRRPVSIFNYGHQLRPGPVWRLDWRRIVWQSSVAAVVGVEVSASSPVSGWVGVIREWWPFALALLVGIGVLMSWVGVLYRHAQWARLVSGSRWLAVRLPAEVPSAGGLVLWRTLTGLASPRWKRLLVGQPHVAVEFGFDAEGARLGVWVPGPVPAGLVEQAIAAAWPGAEVQRLSAADRLPATVPATPHRVPGRGSAAVVAAGGAFGLVRPEWIGLRTRHEVDPLRPLLEVGAGLASGEAVRVQVCARPAYPRRVVRLRKAAATTFEHTAAHPDPVTRLIDTAVWEVLGLLTPRAAWSRRGSADRAPIEGTSDVRAARDKLAQPLWEVQIRYLTTIAARSGAAAGWARARARGVSDAVASAFGVFAGPNQLARRRLRHPAQATGSPRMGRGFVLSVPELAAIAHLPYDVDAPGVAKAGARVAAPSSRVPRLQGSHVPRGHVKVLGVPEASGRDDVGLRVSDARHHLHVLGATGSGKSTLLAHLALQDVAAGRGVMVVDPKGDLVLEILDRLPATVAGKVVLFDPDDPSLPVPRVNLLDGGNPDLVADQVVSIFSRIYAAWWGPRTEDVLRAAVMTLAHPANRRHREVSHLGSVLDLLTVPAFRRRITSPLRGPGGDQVLAGFWSWYEQLTDAARSQAIGPLLNKLRAFVLRQFVRDAISGPSTVDTRAVLDGGICLVRIPKGSLGEDSTRLLGSLLLARTWQAAAARARTAVPRRDCSIYLDEAHNFLSLPQSLEDMLAEARAFHLSLVLAHQNLSQLPRDLRDGISANARNKIYFHSSPEDARVLEHHVTPTLSAYDLAHLDGYTAAARILVGGHPEPAFTLRTQPPSDPIPARADLIRNTVKAAQRR